MNPYEVLGVDAKATAHQIRLAYRGKVKAVHPDAGGDVEAFQLVSRAYSILMNPEARQRFDETGSVDDKLALTARQKMVTILAMMLDQGLHQLDQKGIDVKRFDLIKAMRAVLDGELVKMHKTLLGVTKAVADRKVLLTRITREDDGENQFAMVIKAQLTELEPRLDAIRLEVRAAEMAAEELKHYKSEVELIQTFQMMQWGGAYSNSTSSTEMFRWST